MLKPWLALKTRCRNTFSELLLRKQIDDQDRKDRDHGARHLKVNVGTGLIEKVL